MLFEAIVDNCTVFLSHSWVWEDSKEDLYICAFDKNRIVQLWIWLLSSKLVWDTIKKVWKGAVVSRRLDGWRIRFASQQRQIEGKSFIQQSKQEAEGTQQELMLCSLFIERRKEEELRSQLNNAQEDLK